MPFPLAKLGYMALKQAGKPLANFMKRRAKTSPFFHTRVCLPVAQIYHHWDTNVRMVSLGLAKPTKGSVKPMDESQAVDLGAEMIGETTIFIIGAAILYLEYYRQSLKTEQKETEEDNYLKSMSDNITNLNVLIEKQDAQLREVTRHVLHLQDQFSGLRTAIKNSNIGKKEETKPMIVVD